MWWEFVVKYWLEILFGIIVTGLTTGVTRINKKLKEEKIRNQAIEKGVQCLLRMQILDTYERSKTDGKISVSRKDAIGLACDSYLALGGNGTIKRICDEIKAMPIM